MASNHLLVILFLLSAAAGACGDKQGNETSPEAIIETDDPETPWIAIGEDGRITWFYTNMSGAPTGIGMLMPDGREGYLAINEETGYPNYWVAEGWVVIFTNLRPEEGLVDLGFIDPDGVPTKVTDVAFEPYNPQAQEDPALVTRAAPRSGREKFSNFISALGLVSSTTLCIGSAIITGGTALAIPEIPPVAVPLFSVTASGTVIACGSAASAWMAITSKNPAVIVANDTVVTPYSAFSNAAKCVGSYNIFNCIMAAGDVISFLGSDTIKMATATYVQLTTTPASLAETNVYCCNGPTRIAREEEGTWSAVVDGPSEGPFTYSFSFDDGASSEPETVSGLTLSASHAYADEGDFLVGVQVTSDDETQITAETAAGSVGPFTVEVFAPLEADCCTALNSENPSAGLLEGEPLDIGFTVTEGKTPYEYSLDMDDGTTYKGRMARPALFVRHAYETAKTYQVELTVTDAEGTEVTPAPFSLTIQGAEPDECGEAKRHLCSKIVGQRCSTSTMGKAVSQVSEACGGSEASRFASAAESYCASNTGAFSATTCAAQ